MNVPRTMTRRAALELLAGVAALAPIAAQAGQERPTIVVHKDPNCGCCSGWVEHLAQAGYDTKTIDMNRLNALKARLGVPNELAACHTAEVGPYVIEGHVPAGAIDRLLTERPAAKGLAAPGMPIGSPGMEGGEPETYEVVLFGPQGKRLFAKYRGAAEV